MIYLCAEVISGLGEDTFWTWFKREFGAEAQFGLPKKVSAKDVVLQYSTLGPTHCASRTIGLMWELYPEMRAMLGGNDWDGIISRINNCAQHCARRVVSSRLAVDFYTPFGTVDVLPIGVNTDLFRPMPDAKRALREKYGIDQTKRVGFWMGTSHPMKGFDRLLEWKQSNPDVEWIMVWKHKGDGNRIPGPHHYEFIPQEQLAELMNCADFFLSCGRLRPFFMVEWEAMSCNLPMVIVGDLQKDFVPSSNPRDDIFRLQWDRHSAKELWRKYIQGM
jgi:hypothetical protein